MFLNKYSNYFLGLLRIVSGYAFVLHATAKFWEFPVSMTGGNGAVELASLMGVGGIIELVFGILLYTSPSPRDRTRSRMPSSA